MHKIIQWNEMEANKDGTYSKTIANKYLLQLQSAFAFTEDTFEFQIVKAVQLLIEQKELKAAFKKEKAALHMLTKETIENLSDAQVNDLLEYKWIKPIVKSLHNLPSSIIDTFSLNLQRLAEKYDTTYSNVARDIKKAQNSLASLLDDLTGNEHDIKALSEFKNLLKTKA